MDWFLKSSDLLHTLQVWFSADSQTPEFKTKLFKRFGKAFRFVCLAALCDMQQTSPTKDQTYAQHFGLVES